MSMNNRRTAKSVVFVTALLLLFAASLGWPCRVAAAPADVRSFAPAPRSEEPPRAAVWDRERLIAQSQAGQTLNEYARSYAAVMDANAKTLNDAIAAKTPGLNVAEARRLIAQYKERKAAIARRVDEFLMQLVTAAAADMPQLARGVLLEKTLVTWAAPEADVTDALIASLDAVNVELPELPPLLELKRPAPAPKAAPAPGRPAKNSPAKAKPAPGQKSVPPKKK